MRTTKISRIEIFKTMPLMDKLFTSILAAIAIALFANGLYLVGYNGLLLLLGALVFHFITEIYRTSEIDIIAEGLGQRKNRAKSNQVLPVGEVTNNNDDLIRSIIEKKKKNPQQSLLDGLRHNEATTEEEKEKARADHQALVEMAQKRQEAMRTAVSGPPVDPNVKKEIIEKQEAYIKELMEPTIIPQRELTEKTEKKDKE